MIKPTVSVIIPCYNAAPFLREALDSTFAQTYQPLEVIFIDDGSTDDSAAIAESYGPPVQVIRQKNQGESVARNHGMEVAKGNWLAFLDADDVWTPDRLSRCMEAIRTAPAEMVCCFNGVFRFGTSKQIEHLPLNPPGLDSRTIVDFICRGATIPSAALVRRSAVRQLRFCQNVTVNEDLVFFTELRRNGPFLSVAEHLTGWRISERQQSRQSDYEYRSALTRLSLAGLLQDEIPLTEWEKIKESILNRLAYAHELAYWSRDFPTVRACRQEFKLLADDETSLPACFSRRLLPKWIYTVKDSLDSLKQLNLLRNT